MASNVSGHVQQEPSYTSRGAKATLRFSSRPGLKDRACLFNACDGVIGRLYRPGSATRYIGGDSAFDRHGHTAHRKRPTSRARFGYLVAL